MPSPNRAILLLVFMAVPLLEIALLVKVGQLIGFWATIGIVLATAVLGTYLLHRQGLETLHRVMRATEAGQPPVEPLVDGVLLLLAGVLLITPGIITDTLGLVLLVPQVRKLLIRHVLARMMVISVGTSQWRREADAGQNRSAAGSSQPPNQRGGNWRNDDTIEDGIIIEGEYQRLDERTVDNKRTKQ